MSAHSDTSQKWLIFFFVCFGMSVFGIGIWACFCYNVAEAQKPPGGAGGGHGMITPMDQEHLRSVPQWRIG
ncbi:MAG: hypothetical protein K2X93_01300 [Candidatus Obscuribacterales bacterium]|nr:hypothetical protein [Candidatus Obscuribacterales bacterium]